MEFKEYLKFIRRAKNLTGKEVGEKIGKTEGYILALERGTEKAPTKETTYKIAEALGIKPLDLWEFAALDRFNKWAEKEGIEPARALVFLEETVTFTKKMGQRLSEFIETNPVQKMVAFLIASAPFLEALKAHDILCQLLNFKRIAKRISFSLNNNLIFISKNLPPYQLT